MMQPCLQQHSRAKGTAADRGSGAAQVQVRVKAKGGKQRQGKGVSAVAQLAAMGFSEAWVEHALQASGHSVERAANWLLAGR